MISDVCNPADTRWSCGNQFLKNNIPLVTALEGYDDNVNEVCEIGERLL